MIYIYVDLGIGTGGYDPHKCRLGHEKGHITQILSGRSCILSGSSNTQPDRGFALPTTLQEKSKEVILNGQIFSQGRMMSI